MGAKQTLWLVSAALVAMWPSAGEACSLERGRCGSVVWIGPTVERPTNACVLITPATEGDLGFLTPDAGPPDSGVATAEFAFVANDGTRVALVPGALWCPEYELAAHTEYAFVGPATVDGCAVGGEYEYERFTTGAGPDTTPPPMPEAPIAIDCRREVCENGACCGPYSITIFDATWEPVEDESGVVLYASARGLQAGLSYRWFRENGGYVMTRSLHGGRIAPGSVTAIDIANNQSAASPLTVDCPPPVDAGSALDAATTFDAGLDAATTLDMGPAPDATAAPDAGLPTSASGGGCSASANNSGLLSALVLALAALVHRKRTR